MRVATIPGIAARDRQNFAQDPKVFPTKRAKAVAGLSEIGLQSSSGVLLNLAKSEQAPLTVPIGRLR